MFALKAFWPGEAVTPVATGGRSIGEILARVKPAELPLLQYLCMGGLLTTPSSAPKGQAPAPTVDDDKGKTFTAQEQAARAALFAERDRLKVSSQYHTEAEFHAFLGMAMFRRSGKPEEALPHVQKALEMEPRLQSGTIFLSQIYQAQGEVERAKSLLRKAIERDPDFAEAKDELRRLRSQPAEQAKGGFLSRLLKK